MDGDEVVEKKQKGQEQCRKTKPGEKKSDMQKLFRTRWNRRCTSKQRWSEGETDSSRASRQLERMKISTC